MRNLLYCIRLQIILGLLLFSSGGWAHDVKDFTFTHVGVREGLSSQRAFSLCETTDGAVWAATKNGVDRYNGVTSVIYQLTDRNSRYFAGRVLKFAHSDAKMEMPVVFDNGGRIYAYNKIQDRFDLRANVAGLLNGSVELTDVYCTQSSLWLATDRGFFLLENGKLTPVLRGYQGNYIQPLVGRNFLFCTTRGAFLYTRGGKCTKVVGENVISAYYDTRHARLWLGTFSHGVVVVKPGGHGPWAVRNLGKTIPNNPVRAIRPYGPMMLVGIDGFGVYQVASSVAVSGPETSTVARLLFCANDGPYGVLHGNGIYDILTDSWDNVVMASYSGGLDIARPVGSTTAIFSHIRNSEQSIVDGHVNCVLQYSSDLLLMGTEDGISIYNTSRDVWRHVGRGLVVLDICKAADGKILAATYGNGVCEIGMDGQVRKIYSTENGVLKDDHAYRLLYDREGNLWIGTLYGQLVVKTAQGMRYFDLNNVLAMKQLSDRAVAVGTISGLYKVRLGDTGPRKVNYLPKGADDASRFVLDVCELPDRKLWIATDGGGVYVYDRTTGMSRQITEADGLPSNSVSSIIRDASGRIWIGTEKGLAFIYPDKPAKAIDVSYCYGLNAAYMRGSVARLQNGNLLFGTTDAAVIVNPKNVQKINYSAKLVLTRVQVMGVEGRKTIPADKEMFNEQIANGLANNEIMLKYNQRTFSVSFESINLRNQFDIAYQYRLGDNNWSNPFTQQYISFENLEPGKHHLHIRCVSRTGKTIIDEKELTIYIAQPWWNTWWMWLFYFLMLSLLFRGAWSMYQLHSRYMKLIQESAKDRAPAGLRVVWDEGRNESEQAMDVEEKAVERSAGVEFINKATRIVLDRMMDADFTIDTLCREMSMSRTLFYMKLKTFTGKSPQEFVRVIRLERAASLLRNGKSVSEASMLTGFENPKYFSIVFKKYFDVPPSKYN